MSRFAERIARDYPVRRKAAEKEAFRTWLGWELREMGYAVSLQSAESALSSGGNRTNVVVGDPENAKLILTARYDTGLREIFPPLILPGRPATQAMYLALTPLCLLAASFVFSFALTFALNLPKATLPLFLLLLAAGIAYERFGPSERRTVDESSGAAALLETAAALTPRYRGEVAFVFLDNRGGAAFRKRYPVSRDKTVIHVDCVARGDELLILPGRYARWDEKLLDAVLSHFESTEKKTCFLKTDGFSFYPSENRAFRHSVVLCACEHTALGRVIRPRMALETDEENLRLVREGLCALIASY